jgi:CheY-like chemotaxis protein
VFEAFIQVENPLARPRSGLGIGLTLARALLEKHGGSIRAESEGPGKGTRFVVQLPLVATDFVNAARSADAEAAPDDLKRRILVVDDNEDAALALAMLLRLGGHDVRVAFRGSTALEVAAQFLPEVILMDLGMPGMSGLDTAREIRRQAWGRDVILIAVTGWGQKEDKRKTQEAGFDHHLVKPVHASDIESLLARSELNFTIQS